MFADIPSLRTAEPRHRAVNRTASLFDMTVFELRHAKNADLVEHEAPR